MCEGWIGHSSKNSFMGLGCLLVHVENRNILQALRCAIAPYTPEYVALVPNHSHAGSQKRSPEPF